MKNYNIPFLTPMTPLKSIKPFALCILFFIVIFFNGCSNNTGKCKNCSNGSLVSSILNLHVIDKATGQDLFFGSDPKFNYNQLKIYQTVNNKTDTTNVKVDNEKNLLYTTLNYQSDIDTLALQVGTLKPDVLYLTTRVTNPCCPVIKVVTAKLNGETIFRSDEGSNTITIRR